MKIICSKKEEEDLVRWCHLTFETKLCMECPFYLFCRLKKGTIEKFIVKEK